MHSSVGSSLPDHPVVVEGRWEVRPLTLSWPKLLSMWARLSQYRTLFSDLTRDDFDNFMRYVTSDSSFWLEITEGDTVVGLVTLEGLERMVELDAHVLFFDRDLNEKIPLCKAIVAWVFSKFPIQRLSVNVPTIYYATKRLVEGIGFQREGMKRHATLIGGRWVHVVLFGMTRQEALAL